MRPRVAPTARPLPTSRSRFLNEIPFEDIEFSGIGSAGFEGTGWEKRGDRHGTFGSGMGSICMAARCSVRIRARPAAPDRAADRADDFFGGSSYGTERHRGVSPDAGRVASDLGLGRAASQKAVVQGVADGGAQSRSRQRVAGLCRGRYREPQDLGTGTVISVAGDMIEVQFEKTGQTKS